MKGISKRLSCIYDMVDECNCLADIGCDHGYLPIELVKANRINKAIAADVNEGPLLRAKVNIENEGLSDRIETRRSNGLLEFSPDEVDEVVIAGMGGKLLLSILTQSEEVWKSTKALIVQPQSHISDVRKYLRSESSIVKEAIVKDEGKYYFVIKAHPKSVPKSPYSGITEKMAEEFGEYLLVNKDALLYEYLLKEKTHWNELLNSISDEQRISEIKSHLALIEQCIGEYNDSI